MIKHYLALAIVLLFAAGCQAVDQDIPPISPVPTAQAVHVLLSPEVGPVQSALLTCSAALPEITLRLTELSPGNANFSSGDILIHLGYSPDPGIFHAPLAQETFSLIAHADFPLTTLTVEDLRKAYRGELRTWDDLNLEGPLPETPPSFWTYPAGHPLVNAIFLTLLNIPENLPTNLYLAPDSEAMQQAISETTGAVGFIPDAWLEPDIKRISIEGEPQEFPTLPVLASAREAPEGSSKIFLACLQGPIGQEALTQDYQPWAGNYVGQ